MTPTTRITDDQLAALERAYLEIKEDLADIAIQRVDAVIQLISEIKALRVDLENQKADLTRALAQEEENLRLKERAERENESLRKTLANTEGKSYE